MTSANARRLPTFLSEDLLGIGAEEIAWRERIPHGPRGRAIPDPRTVGGLPEGWQVVAQFHDYRRDTGFYIVRRAAGGVVLWRHDANVQKANRLWAGASLGHIYQTVAAELAGFETMRLRREALALIEAWLRRLVLELFDPSDPVEVAERTLFAIGGPLRVVPRRTC